MHKSYRKYRIDFCEKIDAWTCKRLDIKSRSLKAMRRYIDGMLDAGRSKDSPAKPPKEMMALELVGSSIRPVWIAGLFDSNRSGELPTQCWVSRKKGGERDREVLSLFYPTSARKRLERLLVARRKAAKLQDVARREREAAMQRYLKARIVPDKLFASIKPLTASALLPKPTTKPKAKSRKK